MNSMMRIPTYGTPVPMMVPMQIPGMPVMK
jgi:hypothetical protein